MRYVESRGNDHAVGDKGRSRGPYQIQLAYWIDAGRPRSTYLRDVWKVEQARAAVLAYWRRHCSSAVSRGDWIELARVHNGGPSGAKKATTLAYAAKVREAMR